ncbi:hypothetical protein AXG93_3102s1160 [Marchantia polymorpha subsp. ruderalis]|uniref:Uncharacterized protein n=1 Tax=Marchantia polymorpha subsp. ruderalis TaxID=1480154 RepID=A0A176W881_MARPO|nr:hypothetical protein AXG93_3102s1160 [Marchantia polymorpha subsp. ruderalis]
MPPSLGVRLARLLDRASEPSPRRRARHKVPQGAVKILQVRGMRPKPHQGLPVSLLYHTEQFTDVGKRACEEKWGNKASRAIGDIMSLCGSRFHPINRVGDFSTDPESLQGRVFLRVVDRCTREFSREEQVGELRRRSLRGRRLAAGSQVVAMTGRVGSGAGARPVMPGGFGLGRGSGGKTCSDAIGCQAGSSTPFNRFWITRGNQNLPDGTDRNQRITSRVPWRAGRGRRCHQVWGSAKRAVGPDLAKRCQRAQRGTRSPSQWRAATCHPVFTSSSIWHPASWTDDLPSQAERSTEVTDQHQAQRLEERRTKEYAGKNSEFTPTRPWAPVAPSTAQHNTGGQTAPYHTTPDHTNNNSTSDAASTASLPASVSSQSSSPCAPDLPPSLILRVSFSHPSSAGLFSQPAI